MYRIDDETSASSMPPMEEANAEGFFTEGDPATGIPATVVRASWLNMVQEELRTIVDAGRIDPSKESNKQVLEALRKLFAPIDATGIPVGGVSYFAMKEPPSGYLHANGSAVSRDAYPGLFAAIGTAFGAGDGMTTFNLPDLRGEFVRGWDSGRNVDAGRVFGSGQGDAFQGFRTGQLDASSNANLYPAGHPLADGPLGSGTRATAGDAVYPSLRQILTDGKFYTDGINGIPRIATETRGRSVALLACIKAFDVAENPGLVDITALANQMSDRVPYADFMGTNQSKTANGWQKLPGGMILQWGRVINISLNSVWVAVTFPVAFPNSILNANATPSTVNFTNDAIAAHVRSTTISKTGMEVGGDYYSVGGGNGDIFWTAIGH